LYYSSAMQLDYDLCEKCWGQKKGSQPSIFYTIPKGVYVYSKLPKL